MERSTEPETRAFDTRPYDSTLLSIATDMQTELGVRRFPYARHDHDDHDDHHDHSEDGGTHDGRLDPLGSTAECNET